MVPEPMISCRSCSPLRCHGNSHTFAVLRDDKWALQDFLPTPREIQEIYPSRSEMRLLSALRMAASPSSPSRSCLPSIFTFGAIGLIRRPEWAFNPSEANVIKTRLAKLTAERQKADHWNNLLEDRSKAWTAMESLARMFPENSGMLVKTYSHSTKPDGTPGQAKVGFVKEWKITGFARDEALDYLNALNTSEGINAHFGEIARITGSTAFSPTTGNRNISVNVRTQENNTFKPTPPRKAASPTNPPTPSPSISPSPSASKPPTRWQSRAEGSLNADR
jgi:hypothetical protein